MHFVRCYGQLCRWVAAQELTEEGGGLPDFLLPVQ